jgi:hypothetical protein
MLSSLIPLMVFSWEHSELIGNRVARFVSEFLR